MAETKRYYWIKLKEDFFQDDAISWIEEQKDGKECCLFYLKLCLKSLRNQGVLVRYIGDSLIPYDEISRNYKHSVAYCKKIYQIVVRSWSNHCHGYRRNSNQRV